MLHTLDQNRLLDSQKFNHSRLQNKLFLLIYEYWIVSIGFWNFLSIKFDTIVINNFYYLIIVSTFLQCCRATNFFLVTNLWSKTFTTQTQTVIKPDSIPNGSSVSLLQILHSLPNHDENRWARQRATHSHRQPYNGYWDQNTNGSNHHGPGTNKNRYPK